ncbi:hypothetical protein [Caballeronia sp. dw_19]|uniref:hypothetical protein n=1 Tax=Caballeronia sp. dw_19 TaxID=2719791 RepID=UPI001BCA72F0|nr:hypothetical protein [Caballeronia sp. dw_19]
MLTATELKEIRAVLCEMAARGCIGAQMDRAKKDLIDQFLALRAATAKPAATAK